MKKSIVLFVVWITAAFSVSAQQGGNATETEVTHGEFVLRGTVLVKYLGTEANVIIPADLGITSIGDRVFYNCDTLNTIELPAGLISFGEYAFALCSSLSAIELPSGLIRIGDHSFNGCSSLSTIKFPLRLISIGEGAFNGCNGLETVTIPQTVYDIGDGAFGGCNKLAEIKVSEDNAWYVDREGVLFTKDLTVLVQYPAHKKGSEYAILVSVERVGKGAFNGCDNLSTVNLPANLASIGERAFYSCNSLSAIELPDGVTSIGNATFSDCRSLSMVKLPVGLVSIGDKAFYDCSSLSTIKFPSRLTSIGSEAFLGCESLGTITLPASLTSIGRDAFYYIGLKPITLHAMTPPVLEGPLLPERFAGIYWPTVIYVPATAVDAYKSAAGWKDYADKIQALPSGTEPRRYKQHEDEFLDFSQ
jgi:hypothetical protein